MPIYKPIPVPVQAIQLTTIALHYEKWGGPQQSKRGDWLLAKGDDQYTCDHEVFATTYEPIEGQPGWYTKSAPVEAVKADHAGALHTLEGSSAYEIGDYLVTNPGGDRYPVAASKFEAMYALEGSDAD